MRPAIDVIADVDLDCGSDRATRAIILDPLDHIVEQVGAAVNVAYGINSRIGGKGRV